MKYIKTNNLTDERKQQITQLMKKVNNFDSLTMEAFIAMNVAAVKEFNPYFLAFDNENLVGFVFIYLDEQPPAGEGDIYGYVDPEYRRQGIFNHLLDMLRDELKKHKYSGEQSFCVERKFLNNNEWILNKFDIKENGENEFNLEFEGTVPEFSLPDDLTVEPLKESDIHDLAEVDVRAFESTKERAEFNFRNYLKKPDVVSIFVLRKDNTIIGSLAIDFSVKNYLF